jgi:dTDP-4-amino-4,6-dideoxygalactose transaminase
VVPVHFAGQSCDMRRIKTLSDQYGFRIVEDAAHAAGGKYLGAPIGNCRYSDIAVFSFHPVKIITTGEGGAALTNDSEVAAKMARLRAHGITHDRARMETQPEGPWYYEVRELGWNYRMTDIQAALGCNQMERLDGYVARRTALAERYQRLLGDSGLILPWCDPDTASAWHLYVVGWSEEVLGISRAEAFTRLRAEGIGVQVHYIPVYAHPYFRKLGFKADHYPNAEAHYARALTIPLFATLTDQQQDTVVDQILMLRSSAKGRRRHF